MTMRIYLKLRSVFPVRDLIRRRGSRATPVPIKIPAPEARWYAFLESYTFKKVKNHYFHSCTSERRLPKQDALLMIPYWRSALSMVCMLWCYFRDEETFLLTHGRSSHFKLTELLTQSWNTIVFLIKGVYYLKNGSTLSHMSRYDCGTDFLLHAATDSLSFSGAWLPDDRREQLGDITESQLGGSTSALLVFRDILEKHQNQLFQIGPFQKKMPLHIAASNAMTTENSEDPGCSWEILEEILPRCTPVLACTKDGTGAYPLHLAAKSGYTWTTGLGKIFRMAPLAVDDGHAVSLIVSVACKAPLDTIFELLSAAPHLLRGATQNNEIEAVE